MCNTKTLIVALGLVGVTFGQVKENNLPDKDSNHELKLNIFNVLVFSGLDINYEYLINENSTIGLGVFHKYVVREIEERNWFTIEVEENRKLSITPYYRRYFSKGHANGFFVEGFAMFHSGRDAYFDYIYAYNSEMEPIGEPTEVRTYKPYTRFAIGLSLGGKILFKKGFLMEFYTGFGANPFSEWSYMVTRGGLSAGFRF